MRSEGFPDEDPDSLIQAEDIADAAVFLAAQKRTAHTMELRVSQGLATRYRTTWGRWDEGAPNE